MTTCPAVAPTDLDVAMNRRGFFVNGVVLAGLLLTRPDRAVGRALQDLRTPLFSHASTAPSALALSTFAPYVGAIFRTSAPDLGEVLLRLVEATGLSTRAAEIERLDGEAFSLIFEGSTRTRLESSQRMLTHPAIGSRSVFLSPVGRGLVVQDYQAVFDLRSLRVSTTIRKAG